MCVCRCLLSFIISPKSVLYLHNFYAYWFVNGPSVHKHFRIRFKIRPKCFYYGLSLKPNINI